VFAEVLQREIGVAELAFDQISNLAGVTARLQVLRIRYRTAELIRMATSKPLKGAAHLRR
jgi:hypothetical protein